MNKQALSNYPESLSNKFNVPIQQLREPYNACMSFYCPTGNPNPAFFLLLNLFLVLLNFDMKMHIRSILYSYLTRKPISKSPIFRSLGQNHFFNIYPLQINSIFFWSTPHSPNFFLHILRKSMRICFLSA